MSGAEGTPLSELESLEDRIFVLKEAGEMLRKIHERKLDGFGPLVAKDGELKGKFVSWGEFFNSLAEKDKRALDLSLEKGYLTEEESQKVSEILEEVKSVDFGKGSFLHKDFHKGHIFVKDGKISGVIDLGAIIAGDPRFDIATSLFFQKSEEREAFKEGYGELSRDPFVDKYLLIIALRKILFLSKEEIGGNVEIPKRVLRETLEKVIQSQ